MTGTENSNKQVYRIRKGYKDWSSGTVVETYNAQNKNFKPPQGEVLMRHVPTGKTFTIPKDLLVAKRNR